MDSGTTAPFFNVLARTKFRSGTDMVCQARFVYYLARYLQWVCTGQPLTSDS